MHVVKFMGSVESKSGKREGGNHMLAKARCLLVGHLLPIALQGLLVPVN